ncbi:MAG: putative exported protein [Deltaproteobacteria bacterium]|nr:putative exported protein [Deltaproteobacteria bacterium]
MKRFWLFLLSLGLIAAFSTQAMAVDLKFSGEFYAAGMYLDKTDLRKDYGPGTAFYYQRLRVKTDFIVAPGLTLITRFDAMERAWGAARTATGTALAADSSGTIAENENIAFDWAYIEYKSPIGIFSAGYMNDGSTGTIFGNSYSPKGRIKYSNSFGPVALNLAYTKEKEASYMATHAATVADNDNDKYGIEGVFSWQTGKAGVNVNYYRQATNRAAANPATGLGNSYTRNYFLFTPYVITKFGPVALQGEFNYAAGKDNFEFAADAREDREIRSISGWVDATADFQNVYVGGSVAYVSGDDPDSSRIEGGIINGGRDWNPCLIMFNYYDRGKWIGDLNGWNGTTDNGTMTNAWFFQLRGGFRPIDKLDIMVSVSYARAEKTLKPANTYTWEDRNYGWEVDLVGTYKITNNLSYMLGAGYLFTGDWYSGTTATGQDVQNNLMVINKLSLTF